MRSVRPVVLLAVLGTALGVWLGGCGSSGTAEVEGTGVAAFTIAWPTAASRLIPSAASSIKLVLSQGGQQLATQTALRPATGNSSTVTFNDVPVGQVTATATAHPNNDGTGTTQASAVLTVTIQKDQTTTTPLSLNSTITGFAVTASDSSLVVGDTATLTARATDSGGNTVLIPSVTWSANPTGIVNLVNSRQAQQQVTAAAAGTVTVTARFEESIGDATTERSAGVGLSVTQPAFTNVQASAPNNVVVQRANSPVGTVQSRQLSLVGAPDIAGVTPQLFTLSPASGAPQGLTDINVRAAHDGTNIYFQFDWADATANFVRGPLTMNTTNGTFAVGSDNEDRLALLFDIGGDATGVGGAFSQSGCTIACHGDGLMHTTTGTLDAWHVKMARGVPVGFADDKWWDSNDRQNDTGTSAYSGNDGANNVPNFAFNGSASLGNGLLLQADGAALGGDPSAVAGDYAQQCAGCHGADFTGGAGPALRNLAQTRTSAQVLAALNRSPMASARGANSAEDYAAFVRALVDTPREVLRTPNGSRADVRARAAYNNGRWTLIVWRTLAAPNATEDVAFDPAGGILPFSLAVMNNSGGVHAGAGVNNNRLLGLQFAAP